MKRNILLLAGVASLLLAGCTSDSNLPTPTGKGWVRTINAIPGSPDVTFLIEETQIAGVAYKESSSPVEFDDFSYNFNFEYRAPGNSTSTRMLTQSLKIDADRDHILMLSGTLAAPAVTVWDSDEREFGESDTIIEVRFAHTSASLGSVDVYFEAPGIVPGTNPPAATLAHGEIANAIDFAAGVYVMTVTAAGDTGVVHFTSYETDLLPRFAHVMAIFDGDESDTAPVLVRSMPSVGNPFTLVDANFPSQVRFVQAASTLPVVDVYDDELLTSLVVAGLDFKEATAYVDGADQDRTLYFTPAMSTATILFDQAIPSAAPGSYLDFVTLGDTDNWSVIGTVPNRASTLNAAHIRIFNAALNHASFDVYAVDRGVSLGEDDLALFLDADYEFATPTARIVEGSIDLYITVRGEKTEIAGPYPVDAVLGGVVDLLVVDTVDPLTAEIVDITVP